MRKILSIDLGGSSSKIALVSSKGEIIKRFNNVPTIIGPQVINNIYKQIESKITNIDFDAVSLATAGMLDIKNGKILIAGNLGLKDFPIVEKLDESFSKPSFIINDANAAALGEYWVGSSSNSSSLILYTIGTGIGGGIVIDNKIVTGMNGTAGELGHGGHFQEQVNCNCGLKNCLEPASSALALKRELKKIKNPMELNQVTNEILRNNKVVRDVFKTTWKHLTDHMSIMIYALNPEVIVIGGGVSNIGDEICKIIFDILITKVSPSILKGLKIKLASLGNDAGIYGAAKNALDNI